MKKVEKDGEIYFIDENGVIYRFVPQAKKKPTVKNRVKR